MFEQLTREHGIRSITVDPNFKIGARSKKGLVSRSRSRLLTCFFFFFFCTSFVLFPSSSLLLCLLFPLSLPFFLGGGGNHDRSSAQPFCLLPLLQTQPYACAALHRSRKRWMQRRQSWAACSMRAPIVLSCESISRQKSTTLSSARRSARVPERECVCVSACVCV